MVGMTTSKKHTSQFTLVLIVRDEILKGVKKTYLIESLCLNSFSDRSEESLLVQDVKFFTIACQMVDLFPNCVGSAVHAFPMQILQNIINK